MMTNTFQRQRQRHISISDDFDLIEYEPDSFVERYDLTPQIPDQDSFIEFLVEHHGESKEILVNSDTLFEDFYNCLPDYWSDEDRDHYSFDEQVQVPMMSTLWYYPSFVSFTDQDRLKTVGCITLLFDNELNRWAIGMCGGGMDLTPQLVASFINLDQCVPLYLAQSMQANYPGYLDKMVHHNNCYLVGIALQNYGNSIINRGSYLEMKSSFYADPLQD